VRSDKLLLMTITDPTFIHALMEFTTKVTITYAKAWIDAGLGIIVFDSFCSPPLISPQTYRQLVLPYQTKIMNFFKQEGIRHRVLVIGGNTTEIAEDIAKTGATLILCDYNADLEHYLKVSEQAEIALRGNVDPALVFQGSIAEITDAGDKVVGKGKAHSGFILGTGVLPYNTPREHVLALKACVQDLIA